MNLGKFVREDILKKKKKTDDQEELGFFSGEKAILIMMYGYDSVTKLWFRF